jgi:hydroxymethylbilane synthase
VDYVLIKTRGDKILDVPLARIGGKGLFVKEIEDALLDRRVDIAVHSVKDIPGELPDGLQLTALPPREDPRDILISREGTPLEALRKGARVGTSSVRRKAQLLRLRPDLTIVPVRGNLDTRIRKIEIEGLDGVVLAAAGVRRMGLASRITEFFPVDEFLPALGQGVLGIETREGDEEVNEMVRLLEDPLTRICVEAERAFLRRMEGGCQVPIGGIGRVEGPRLRLKGMVAGLEGAPMFSDELAGPTDRAEEIGVQLADRLLDGGAREILHALYGQATPPVPPP